VARELIELQRDVTALLQGQKDLSTQMTQDHTVMKTLVEQSGDTVGKLNGTMSALQKSVQDVQANSGARLDTMSTQVQGLSDNLEEIKSRLGKLNQQLVDLQNTVQSVDAKISGGGASTPSWSSTRPTPSCCRCSSSAASRSPCTSTASRSGAASGGPSGAPSTRSRSASPASCPTSWSPTPRSSGGTTWSATAPTRSPSPTASIRSRRGPPASSPVSASPRAATSSTSAASSRRTTPTAWPPPTAGSAATCPW